MRVSLPTLIIVIISFAALLGITLYVLDRYLDLRVVSYTVDATRQASNLLQGLLTSSSIVAGNKLILKEGKIRDTNSLQTNWDICCDPTEYDFDLKLSWLDSDEKIDREIDNINPYFNLNSSCYLNYQRIKGNAEMPISVCNESQVCFPGLASITLMRTPVSELAFWLSSGSLRMKEKYDESLVKSINIDGGNKQGGITQVKFERNPLSGQVCMTTNNGDKCKTFTLESNPVLRICNPDCNILNVGQSATIDTPGTCGRIILDMNEFNLNVSYEGL